MATKAKKASRKKSVASRRGMKGGSAGRKSAKRAGAKRSAAKRPAARRSSAKRSTAKRTRPAARKSAGRKRSASKVARVKRVTQQVVQQATSAVSAGMDTLRDLGETFVERVRND